MVHGYAFCSLLNVPLLIPIPSLFFHLVLDTQVKELRQRSRKELELKVVIFVLASDAKHTMAI